MAAPSYPQFTVTGPVHHYIQVPEDSNNIYYLGTAEVTPKVEHRPMFKDVFNDIAGRSLPMQKTNDGEMAVVGVLLNRFSKSAYAFLKQAGVAAGLQLAAGQESRWSRGGLVFGRKTFKMWQVFENATDPTIRAQYPGLELGFYWPQVLMVGHTRDTLGSEVEKLLLVVEAHPYWTPQASNNSVQAGERTWLLYSSADSAFPDSVKVLQ